MDRDDLMQVDDALPYIRRHPEMFFRGGSYVAEELASLIVREALQAGVPSVDVIRDHGWIVIHSSVDWLEGDEASFRTIVPFPKGGQNAMRAEVLATAFAEAVATRLGGVTTTITGAGAAVLDRYGEQGRTVAFK